MTIKYADRVRETSISTGTGVLTLAGAAPSYRNINIVFNNDTDATGLPFDYVINHATNNTFEVGTGHLTVSNIMSRDTVDINSNETTGFINFTSGGLTITVTPSRKTFAALEVETLTVGGNLARSITDAITAGATQTQAGATALITDINRITTSVTNGDGVKLPFAQAGLEIIIVNDASSVVRIWPNSFDSIDGGAVDASDTNVLPVGTRRYIATDNTNWYTAT